MAFQNALYVPFASCRNTIRLTLQQNECALNYLATHPDCPLTTQPCICDYLSYYSSCVADSCNSTDANCTSFTYQCPWIPQMTALTDKLDSGNSIPDTILYPRSYDLNLNTSFGDWNNEYVSVVNDTQYTDFLSYFHDIGINEQANEYSYIKS